MVLAMTFYTQFDWHTIRNLSALEHGLLQLGYLDATGSVTRMVERAERTLRAADTGAENSVASNGRQD